MIILIILMITIMVTIIITRMRTMKITIDHDSIIFYLLFYSVTQRANHAKDYLLKEGLEKIDG